eukprot:CAMPEP_0198234066 /NCGR_PEP_ID=MMETSP1446-20131203/160_1 /TAXON_ID=1461542 ORGANISM="Unidentified sp, Strain CCMP2111" /NCGR_SAMPLE_ID=MMETSP1446 /ASSEMBLY_ACC=CAM_ASM_001112 /LENGTH=202 /DNA_ID=CAMNT_0043914795 /DNA_START=62 /DNA_END=670 /DNA_ORIENTATION=+
MADAGKAAGGGAMGEAAPKHERTAAAMGDIGGKVQDFASHPCIPVIARVAIFIFSLLSWSIMASTGVFGAPTVFQLVVGILIWIFSILWLVVEVATLQDVSLPGITGSIVFNHIEIISDFIFAYLAFGSAASVAGVTDALCSSLPGLSVSGSFCAKLIASNCFMWFTWLVQVIPCAIFTIPAIAKAGQSESATVMRAALNTR